jgi:primosomal protein N' (replication factor Y)
MKQTLFAQVAVPVPVKGPFSYEVPESLQALATPGMRVRVPFGGRRLAGTIIAISSTLPDGVSDSQVRPLLDCLDPQPLLSAAHLALTGWMAETTMSSWGEAIRTSLPAGLESVGQRRVVLTPEGAARLEQGAEEVAQSYEPPPGELPLGPPASAPGDRRLLLERLIEQGGKGLKLSEIAKYLDSDSVCALVYGLAAEGLVRVEDEWSEGIGGRWQQALRPAEGISREAALAATPRAPAQRRLVSVLWDHDSGLARAAAMQAAGCTQQVVRALIEKGLVATCRVPAEDTSAPAWTGDADGAGTFDLTSAQRVALEQIEAALASRASRPLVLHGVTGSGKTEVYLRAALSVIEKGRSAILMVPEIGLTPLFEHRARAVLGDRVVVMHSGMAKGQRIEAWWRARRGKVPVVIGPRSAVFAPLPEVGLIVLDEEQDGAYKQDENPRYHGRQVALRRAELEGAVAVLGSATPAVETYHGARSGNYEYLELPERVASRPLPEVRVVDMRETFQSSGRTLLSAELEEAIGERLERGEQSLILLNRRGFAASLLCRVCGERVPCPDCAVSLTVHRQRQALVCHYCDHRQPIPAACPHCGAEQLHEMGHGTQQLQQSLEALFPAARCQRFDADETRRRGAHGRILSAFSRGELDILVGTQMLAKGHDFPGVTLVGIVGADDALGLPDFRAAERTFQLLTQMAGRAGRGDLAGTVVLQAYKPDHYAIRAAMAQDYDSFYSEEIEFRRRLGYPPYTALIACVCRGKSLPALKEEADWLAAAVRKAGGRDVRVFGPASPVLARLRGFHRMQVLIKGESGNRVRDVLSEALGQCAADGRMPRDLRIDVDPLNLM